MPGTAYCTAVVLYGGKQETVAGAYQRYDGVPFREVVSMSYPKDMYVRRCGLVDHGYTSTAIAAAVCVYTAVRVYGWCSSSARYTYVL